MASLHSPRIPLSPSNSKTCNRIPNFPTGTTTGLLSSPYCPALKRRLYHHDANPSNSAHHDLYPFNSTLCRCKNANSSGDSRDIRWDLLFQDALKGAAKRCQEYLSSYWNSLSKEVKEEVISEKLTSKESGLRVTEEKEIDEWNWERWKQHFEETQESESLFHVLKVQLRAAIAREDYKSAERFKQAIATAAKYDAVGKALSDLNRAIEEERYTDASNIRDSAGAGLIGWWAGVSENKSDPNGLIVRITAEYGRYVAKSYNSRQLTSSSPGWPLFEVYFTEKNGQFKQQSVYINPTSSKKSGEFSSLPLGKTLSILSLLGGKTGGPISDELNLDEEEEEEEKDEPDLDILDLSPDNNNNITLPPLGFKILKVSSGGKIDRDHIAKIIDQILEEEEEEEEEEENSDDEEESEDEEEEGIEEIDEIDEENEEEMTVDFDISQEFEVELETDNDEEDVKNSEGENVKTPGYNHVPARLEQKGRYSFTLHLDKNEKSGSEKGKKSGTQEIKKKKTAVSSILKGSDLDLGKKKIFIQIIAPGVKNLLSQYKSKQRLSGSTHFRRIMTPVSSDPLTGLYISASGMDSEILCLQRKFGHWKNDKNDDFGKGKNTNFEFYEYVEAVKLIGGHLAPPAGQVMFRAKVGKQHQLPHDGLIPKELGVIGRYKGQGKVPEPGSKKTQWVDGELVILDGKFINNGPMIGFFYWSSKLHFFEFFARLNLPE